MSTIAVFITRSIDCTVVAYKAVSTHGLNWRSTDVSYINDAAQSSNGIGTEDSVTATASILHDRTRYHNDVLGGSGQLLDNKVDHLSKACIFVLKKFRNTEEKSCSLIGWEMFAGIEKKGNLGQENTTLSGLDGGAVEQSCCPPG